MDAGVIREIDRGVRLKWSPKSDGKVDVWRSFYAVVEDGTPFAGDCDDLTTTVMQMLCLAGLDLNDGWFLLVDTNDDRRGDHLVGAVRDTEGGYWIAGDTLSDGLYASHLMKHKPMAYFKLSEMTLRDGLPWARVN